MRIIILNDGYRNCGGALQLIKYANTMVRLGHAVTLAYTASWSFDLIAVSAQRVYCPNGAAELPDADVVMCSTWYMARTMAALPASKGEKFAYVQGFEVWSGESRDIIDCWRLPVHHVVPSLFLQEQLFIHTTKRPPIVPFGIDFDIFNPGEETAGAPRRLKELVVGALYNSAPMKRPSDLAVILEDLTNSGRSIRIRLFGFEPRPNLPFAFEYRRMPDPATLAEMYRGCHLWLSTSDMEGLHVPPMEAMACGAVPVSSDIGGTRDCCLHGFNGLRFPVGDSHAAVSAILELGDDPDRWLLYRRRSIERIYAMGSEEDNVKRLLSIFEQALIKRNMGRSGLFSFDAAYRPAVTTLAIYLQQAKRHVEGGEIGLALDLANGIAVRLNDLSVKDRDFFVRYGQLFSETQFLLHRLGVAADLERAARLSSESNAVVLYSETLVRGIGRVEDSQKRADGLMHVHLLSGNNASQESIGPEAWSQAINRENRHVVFEGPEPLRYDQLPELINGVATHIMVHVRTALHPDFNTLFTRIEREVNFHVVWQTGQDLDKEKFVQTIDALRKNPRLAISIDAEPGCRSQKESGGDLEFFVGHGLVVKPSLTESLSPNLGIVATKNPVVCRLRQYLIGPNGFRYQCVSRLQRREKPMESLFDDRLGPEPCLSRCLDSLHCMPEDRLTERCIVELQP